MKFPVQTSPHVEAPSSVADVMTVVLWALVPGTVAAIWLLGWGVLFNVALAVGAAWLAEALMLWLRARPFKPALTDRSVLITGWILALCLPNLAPWWLPVVGAVFAVVVAKQLYGGIGYNLFNPAMVGYVVLLVSFPEAMTRWGAPVEGGAASLTLAEAAQWTFLGVLPGATAFDALSQATPLDQWRMVVTQGGDITGASIWQGGAWSVWLNLAFLAGGAWMLYRGAIRWHIPVAMVAGVLLTAALLWGIDPERFADPLFHLVGGGVIFGALFVATDPVTASTTPRGRLVFGFGIGVLAVLIRSFGNYPDGVAFAILLMNLAVPLIDYYTQPPVFGRKGPPRTGTEGR
ncbi:RnfABCDGE type electron transport complex subunit D [Guyparkeria sp. SB14A]|uniref:RnfABCDGE type electron transport complex subunit D n=1 Tax=Guyparkeria sp. SB14A TaxID=2571147 RepID=UPI0010ACC24F|nr:RnfABCDGE type electron transport complex subunit D [Guyparkeria sp. SB14A]TKA91075.1 RnfABCDGE type electron transport complex subunit D [Guyparkeria sp. SB14A]